jgi:hypothetical protein
VTRFLLVYQYFFLLSESLKEKEKNLFILRDCDKNIKKKGLTFNECFICLLIPLSDYKKFTKAPCSGILLKYVRRDFLLFEIFYF